MAERIELPPELRGTTEEQLKEIRSYLYRIATALNTNQALAGSETVSLTDDERVLMENISRANAGASGVYQPAGRYAEAETLKSLIIKTAQFVKNVQDNYNLILYGEESAQSDFGTWNRKKGLRVDVTPDGIKQTYSYAEIIKGLKEYAINAKCYIKTGYLHDDDQELPVYGVAIGKDIVTFSEDGSETYVDGNKVAELTADELAFYQNETKVASYTGSKLSFYNNGVEVMYIQNGKLYAAGGLEITSAQGIKMTSSGFVQILGKDNSIIQLVGINEDDQTQTIFQADSSGVVQAKTIESSEAEMADLTVTNLTVRGNMNAAIPIPNIVISTNPPASGNSTIWLEPNNGVLTPFSYTESVNDAHTGSSWTTITTKLKWTQTCNLAAGIAATGAKKLKISGKLYKNGGTTEWTSTLEVVVNLRNSNVSTINLGTVGTFPNNQSLRWDYGFSKEYIIDQTTPIDSGEIESITYTWTISGTTDEFANLSYPHAVTLTCSGETGSGSSDECTVHYIP